jgi:hypothetical protein
VRARRDRSGLPRSQTLAPIALPDWRTPLASARGYQVPARASVTSFRFLGLSSVSHLQGFQGTVRPEVGPYPRIRSFIFVLFVSFCSIRRSGPNVRFCVFCAFCGYPPNPTRSRSRLPDSGRVSVTSFRSLGLSSVSHLQGFHSTVRPEVGPYPRIRSFIFVLFVSVCSTLGSGPDVRLCGFCAFCGHLQIPLAHARGYQAFDPLGYRCSSVSIRG